MPSLGELRNQSSHSHHCIKGLILSGNPGWEGLLWRLSLLLTSVQLVERGGKRTQRIPWEDSVRGQARVGNINCQCSISWNGSVLSLTAGQETVQLCVQQEKKTGFGELRAISDLLPSLLCFLTLLCFSFSHLFLMPHVYFLFVSPTRM